MHIAAVHAVGSQRGQFEKRRSRIEQQIDAITRQQFSARHMARPRLFAAALHRSVELSTKVRDEAFHRLGVVGEFARFRIEGGMNGGHCLTEQRNLRSVALRGSDLRVTEQTIIVLDRISASCRTIAGRSTCAVSRWCPRRSRRAWHHADTVRGYNL